MKLALLADIHGNLEALRACLDHARSHGAERYAFLGDLVGYGADPGPVVDLVRSSVDRGALAVLGNHDAAVLAGGSELMHDAAERAIAWSHARLLSTMSTGVSREVAPEPLQLFRLLGTVSTKVAAEAPCTVTVVRPRQARTAP